jgi:chromosomal replication initiation ATPase DnaA
VSGGQLVFELGGRPALGTREFLVAPCNQVAVAMIDRWPDWPAPVVALAGPEGSGKTHLVHVWRERSGAVRHEARDLAGRDPYLLLGDCNAAAVEDVDQGGDEVTLFHLHNVVLERRGTLLVTGREPPSRWPIRLADLRSRLAAAPTVAVAAPDDRLLAGVLAKQFADRQVRVQPDVIEFLVLRMERSFAALQGLVDALDRAALASRRPITVPLAREVLARLTMPELFE